MSQKEASILTPTGLSFLGSALILDFCGGFGIATLSALSIYLLGGGVICLYADGALDYPETERHSSEITAEDVAAFNTHALQGTVYEHDAI